MINIQTVLKETGEVRARMWALWDSMKKGEAKGIEVKNHIAIANVILNGHKVDIAAAHFLGNAAVVLPPPEKNKQVSAKAQGN